MTGNNLLSACLLICSSCCSYAQSNSTGYQAQIDKAYLLYEKAQYLSSAKAYSLAFRKSHGEPFRIDRYNAACSWARAGFADSAFHQLNQILNKNGYLNYRSLTSDKDLISLHKDARWQAMELTVRNKADIPPRGYQKIKLEDFVVFVNDTVLLHSSMADSAIHVLTRDLATIKNLPIKPAILDLFQSVPIFMEWDKGDLPPTFIPSEQWQIEHGGIPEKTGSIEIRNVTSYAEWHKQHSPMMLLHEFAHAYHYFLLGFDNQLILDAYQRATGQKMYLEVGYHKGSGVYTTTKKAYAMENEMEFFAELTESYFGLNETYPFNREDIRNYDPMAYQMLSALWN